MHERAPEGTHVGRSRRTRWHGVGCERASADEPMHESARSNAHAQDGLMLGCRHSPHTPRQNPGLRALTSRGACVWFAVSAGSHAGTPPPRMCTSTPGSPGAHPTVRDAARPRHNPSPAPSSAGASQGAPRRHGLCKPGACSGAFSQQGHTAPAAPGPSTEGPALPCPACPAPPPRNHGHDVWTVFTGCFRHVSSIGRPNIRSCNRGNAHVWTVLAGCFSHVSSSSHRYEAVTLPDAPRHDPCHAETLIAV